MSLVIDRPVQHAPSLLTGVGPEARMVMQKTKSAVAEPDMVLTYRNIALARMFAALPTQTEENKENAALLPPIFFDLASLLRDDEDFVPARSAFMSACEILFSAYAVLGCAFPNAKVVSDGEGGIEIYFNRPSNRVDLIVPDSPVVRPFIYIESTSGTQTVPNATASTLVACLRWLAAV
jgi:hypothetical protein